MLKLELGCGVTPTPGYVHHDRIKHSPYVDVAWDLRHYPWPFAAGPDGRIIMALDPAAQYPRAEAMQLEHDLARRLGVATVQAPAADAFWIPDGPTFPHGTAFSGFLDEILALDVFEHLSVEIQPWLDECWKLLQPEVGILDMRLPAWDHALSYRDPTHLRVFHPQTFHYFDPDSELHRRFGAIYFQESNKWWKIEKVYRENNDLRYRLRKRGG